VVVVISIPPGVRFARDTNVVDTIRLLHGRVVALEVGSGSAAGVRLQVDAPVARGADARVRAIRYRPLVALLERRLARLRTADPRVVDGVLAVAFAVVGVATVFLQDIRDDAGMLVDGFAEPGVVAGVTAVATCAPIAIRRRSPLVAVVISSCAIVVHFLASWPPGLLPLAALLLTYTVGAWSPLSEAVVGLAVVATTIVVLGVAGAPGLDTVDTVGVLAQYAAAWAIGSAMRSRRAAAEALVRQADERAEAERQSSARVLAEERLRIAQELHDVVAHSMSVIAVQAGVGAHVVEDRPEQARAVLDTISTTSRGTLVEMRRLLGVLRGGDGARAHVPAPGLADLPQLVADVRAAGVPVTLHLHGATCDLSGGIDLSAYRVVQEALTNVIKHAGTTTRVDVTVRHLPGSLAIEVVDDGRGLAAAARSGAAADGSGHGLLGMRERVELWGGELSVGPAPGGGYRVAALLPYGDAG
jgi:signal transduction histidine kinase